MTKKTEKTKVEELIFSRIDRSLETIQEELNTLGFDDINVAGCKQHITKILQDYYSQGNESSENDAQGVIFTIGDHGKKAPSTIPISMCIYALRQRFGDFINGPLKELEGIQDKKSTIWAKNVCGEEEIDINYRTFQVTRSYPRKVAELLNITKQVMEHDPAKLRQLLKRIPNDAEGENAFIRDLGQARLAGPEFEKLIKDLLEAESEDVLDNVVEHPAVAESEHAAVIAFLARILKEKLGLSDSAQEQLANAMAV